ncbi:MAG: ABC transporter ATP-binding protein [Chloroflexi bacterium]|nr:ABC transporter ATP-binding protein [Chloroflexota bacterium]MCL5110187.1 ABC transporter ATP-binding protein [Chloroflexota bacterium]
MVFEEQNLYERLSARNNLRFNCWLYDLPERRIEEMLELAGLRERAKDPVRTYSNSMKQRLMIARALPHKPPVLFLDEPTRGLDPVAARDVRGTIEQLRQEGTTILLTTHLLDEADHLCQRLSFIVAGGTPRDLKLSYGKRAVVLTLADPSSAGQLSDVTLSVDDPDEDRSAVGRGNGAPHGRIGARRG